MTDLSAYRERFPAVGKYERLMDGAFDSERNLPQFLRAPKEYADAALAALAKALGEAEDELAELDSYNGHLAWMDKHYPLDVPYFAEGEDVGCQVMRLSRKIMRAESELAEFRAAAAGHDLRAVNTRLVNDNLGYREDLAKLVAELAELKGRRCDKCDCREGSSHYCLVWSINTPDQHSCADWTERREP